MNYHQLRECLLEEGLNALEILYIAWAFSGNHVVNVEVASENLNYTGWLISKDDDDLYQMRKVP